VGVGECGGQFGCKVWEEEMVLMKTKNNDFTCVSAREQFFFCSLSTGIHLSLSRSKIITTLCLKYIKGRG